MSEQNVIEYFTRSNLETFLREIKKMYMPRSETAMGLKLTEIQSNAGLLQIKDIHQGNYYYCKDPVKQLKLGNLMGPKNKTTMGEVMIQFKTDTVFNTTEGEYGSSWNWIDEEGAGSPTFYPDSEYLIHITSDNQSPETIYAKVKRYESIISDASSTNSIEITYKFASAKAISFTAVRSNWVNAMSNSITRVLYAPENGNYTDRLKPANLLSQLKCSPVNGICSPKIKIIFKDDMSSMTLQNIMRDIKFNSFVINISDSVGITSAENAFSGSADVSSINLSGIPETCWTSCSSFKSMFDMCKAANSTQRTLEIGGMNTANATSLSGLFNSCTLLNESNAEAITSIIRVDNCSDFSYMFNDTKIKNINIKGWDVNTLSDTTLDFSNMFAKTNINDKDFEQVSEFVGRVFEKLENESDVNLNYGSMFDGCNWISDLSVFRGLQTVNEQDNKDKFTVSSINAKCMFASCANIKSFPILKIYHQPKEIIMSSMFAGSGHNSPSIDFSNLGDWSIPMLPDGGITKLDMNSMFINCAFDKSDSDINIFKNTITGDGIHPGAVILNSIFFTTQQLPKGVKVHFNLLLNQTGDKNTWKSNYNSIVKKNGNIELYVRERLHYIMTKIMKDYYEGYTNIHKI